MTSSATKVVILAAGQGTRMRRSNGDVQLSKQQAAVADKGVKALIPVGRPFLDYVLTRVADAGCREVCLVVGPQHDEIRAYYSQVVKNRLQIAFAVQQTPLGTADALAAAANFVGSDPFLVLNSDNCYPTPAIRILRLATGNAVVGFDRTTLIHEGAIAAERIAQFAILEPDDNGFLKRIVEKPAPDALADLRPPILVSMNCWRFGPEIFQACRMIGRSPRGEYEIPDAVMCSLRSLNQRYRVLACNEVVLDLSRRSDIASVTQRLVEDQVRL
jgi:glucose-1-phosphate thymidylyltransferase